MQGVFCVSVFGKCVEGSVGVLVSVYVGSPVWGIIH